MAPRRRCAICGSRQWHKASGLIACSEGHILQDYRNETIELQETGPHAMKKRTLKSGKKGKERRSKGDPKLYHGARARYHYFLCLQILFRKQVETLMKLWELPSEFENLCRDFWALYLELMPIPISPEPYNFARQDGTNDLKHTKPAAVLTDGPLLQRKVTDYPDQGVDLQAGFWGGNESGSDSGSESSSSRDLNDDEIEELMRENSEFSSSDTETGDGAGTSKSGAAKEPGQSKSRSQRLYESPANTVAILVLACWVLRIPIAYRDFSRIIESYQLPYLDPVHLLPQTMVQHLTKHSQQALTPHHAPSTLLLHKLASRLADKCYSRYSIFIPEINGAPLLWRVVRFLGGTPTLYALTKRISSILSLPLALRPSLTSALAKHKSYDPSSHQYDNTPPEVSLMASCVIALKIVYGLDGKERRPRDATDPAYALPSRDAYLELVRTMERDDAKKPESVFSTQSPIPDHNRQIEKMSEAMLDGYLSFCGKALLGPNTTHDVLDAYFPLVPDHVSGHAAVAGGVGSPEARVALPAVRVQDGAEIQGVLKPGEQYKIWNARDVLGALPEDYALVLSRATRWVGTPEEYLEGVIETYEKRLFLWYEKSQRRAR